MRVIALCGASGSRKTTLLRELIRRLVNEGCLVTAGDLSNDRRVLLRLDEKTLGICLDGDDSDIIEENFRFVRCNKCDVAIIALRVNDKQHDLCGKFFHQCANDVPFFVYKVKESWVQEYDATRHDMEEAAIKHIYQLLKH